MSNKLTNLLIIFVSTSFMITSCYGDTLNLKDGLYADIQTARGRIVVELLPEKAPLTVANFVGLAEGTLGFAKPQGNFYDGLTFHRVIQDFMIQGGDPQGSGMGGPGYSFADETLNGLVFDKPGILAMANSGPNTNGSQFFITHVPTPHLNGKHTIFGKVSIGQEVVDMVGNGDKMESVKIIRKGKKAEAYQVDDAFFEKVQREVEDTQAKAVKASLKLVKESWPNAVPQDGVYIIVEKEGVGEVSSEGDMTRIHYSASLLDGSKSDSSHDREQPIELALGVGQVFEGWDKSIW